MTRINVGINPRLLTNEHLIAEHREIKRLCDVYYKRKLRGYKFPEALVKDFTLGKGHVLFFVNKPYYTYMRYDAIHRECLHRGMEVQSYHKCWTVYFGGFFNHYKILSKGYPEWEPAKADVVLLANRIIDNIKSSPKLDWKLEGKKITPEEAIKLVNKAATYYPFYADSGYLL